jgi:hypothetical protein
VVCRFTDYYPQPTATGSTLHFAISLAALFSEYGFDVGREVPIWKKNKV